MAATPHDGSGTTVSFGGSNYVVTNITYNLSDPATDQTIDVSHLGLTVGSAVLTQSKPLTGSATNTGREVMIEYLGTSIIADASTGTLTITTGSGTTFLSKNATVASSSVTFALNDVVKGTATFKVAR